MRGGENRKGGKKGAGKGKKKHLPPSKNRLHLNRRRRLEGGLKRDGLDMKKKHRATIKGKSTSCMCVPRKKKKNET